MKKFIPKIPGALVVVILGILLVKIFNLGDHGLDLVGYIPTGLPEIGLPALNTEYLGVIFFGAIGVVLIGFSESIAAARKFAAKNGYEIDPDQEILAQSTTNISSGLVQGFGVNGSLSKSAVNDQAEAKSELASLIQAGLVFLTVLFLASLFSDLPQAVLGAIVIFAVAGLMDIKGMRHLRKAYKLEFWIAVMALLGVLTFGSLIGILLGIALSLLLIVAKSSTPYVPILGRAKSGEYHDVSLHEDVKTNKKILALRFGGPIYFASANALMSTIKDNLANQPETKTVIVDMVSVNYIDTEGVEMLKQLSQYMEHQELGLYLVNTHKIITKFIKNDDENYLVIKNHISKDSIDDIAREVLHSGKIVVNLKPK